jgi:HEAT repeat protein
VDHAAPHDVIANPLAHLADADPIVRRLAVSACAPLLAADADMMAAVAELLRADPQPRVRAEAAEVLGMAPGTAGLLLAAAGDADPTVCEAVATALGEQGDRAAVPWLLEAVAGDDRMVQEAAVAALGAIGDPVAIPLLVELAASGAPQVRRRAVVSLTAFDHDDAEAAIARAAEDRNPMVREVAEMIVGRAKN